jgi:gliding motility-associated-like protein
MNNDTGTYRIKLRVKNTQGCMDSTFDTVRIFPELTFFMPNAFSPNGDDQNDVFKPVGFLHPVTNYEFVVWNRWGEIIYKTNQPEKGWNGRKYNTGQPVQSGTYIFQLHFTDNVTGETYQQEGYVVLIR